MGLYRDNGKDNGNYYIGAIYIYMYMYMYIRGNYHIVCWGFMGMMEKNMETFLMGCRGSRSTMTQHFVGIDR